MLVTSAALAQRSPVQDLLARARTALNNLEYARADTMARGVLAFGTQLTRAQRIDALQIVAAALYPEEEGLQRRDSAVAYLRQLIRLAPDRDLPRAISWPGLDSLLVRTKLVTFAAIARPPRDSVVAGEADATIPVSATRPARFRLIAVPARGGTPIPIDSAGPGRDVTLRLRLLVNDRPRLATGDYELRITAVDTAAGAARDSIVLRYGARVSAPTLTLVPIPTLDSARLLPEKTIPSRGRNIAIGVGLGAATALFATMFRAPDPVKSEASIGSGAYLVGAAMTAGAIVGGTRDRGAPIVANIAQNSTTRAAHAQAVQTAQAENARRRTAYRATLIIEPEPR
jgi:hypothetical protein